MNASLTPGQRAQLRAQLELRQHELDRRLAAQTGAQGRAVHAHDVLQQDVDDAPQRDADREVDLALTDSELAELGAVSRALARLDTATFGVCVACHAPIPFDRLRAEPWAERCAVCESKREGKVSAPRL